ncbi:MBOAT family O-acyltransferase [Xylanibacter ruminicola]|uniref:MBOAT family O-acyltransferase n=1 Tax=Xylanibacter ruminicola TaxID=839 RepID=UPI00048DDB8B|nr:MBOAT family O-acyltransferase [Xylanibacter ruminicola]
MIFNSFNFVVFFPLIFLLYYIIPVRFGKARNAFLLFVSYLLYLQWKPIYALFLLGVTLVTYFSALLLPKVSKPYLLLVASVLLTIFPLFFFKYFNFVNESLLGVLELIGIRWNINGLNWAIPVGISFFTFQALGYLWDVYYKRIEAENDFLSYALFISFFPSILSGPINKASLVIPQIKNLRTYFDYEKAVKGARFLLWGMFMKVAVADRLAIFVDTVYEDYMANTGLTCFAASVFYSLQIYADFAGYSLMAIGVGKILGFELTENFRRPYFAVSVTEFWHRWHISLSTWLKDYIYIPLGGSRCSKGRNYWNIFVTFFVSGIWHGANWTFIIWGCVHGICQIFEKILGQQKNNYGLMGTIIKILLTFLIVNFAWIFFRMPTISDALGMIIHIFDISQPMTVDIPQKSHLLVLFILIAKDFLDEYYSKLKNLFDKSILIRWSIYIIVFVIIMLQGVFGADQFIYVGF